MAPAKAPASISRLQELYGHTDPLTGQKVTIKDIVAELNRLRKRGNPSLPSPVAPMPTRRIPVGSIGEKTVPTFSPFLEAFKRRPIAYQQQALARKRRLVPTPFS